MINGISPILSVYASSSNNEIKKNLKCENIPIWNEEGIMKREFEEERTRVHPSGNSSVKSTRDYNFEKRFELKRKVQQTYNIFGKLIEYYDLGRYLDFMA
jgi:hypothetical protein